MILLPIMLVAIQPHLSATLAMLIIIVAMLFLGGVKKRILALLIGMGGILTALMLLVNDYQRKRVTDFIASWVTGQDGYQLLQSKIAFGVGHIAGVGLGKSKQKMFFLPEADSDAIFSIFGEEFGLIGALLLLAGFVFLFVRALKICMKQEDLYRLLLGSGIAVSIILYAIVHISVTIGIIPLTGLPLPFISKGGTALIVLLWGVGVLINLSRDSHGISADRQPWGGKGMQQFVPRNDGLDD